VFSVWFLGNFVIVYRAINGHMDVDERYGPGQFRDTIFNGGWRSYRNCAPWHCLPYLVRYRRWRFWCGRLIDPRIHTVLWNVHNVTDYSLRNFCFFKKYDEIRIEINDYPTAMSFTLVILEKAFHLIFLHMKRVQIKISINKYIYYKRYTKMFK